jgi:hypothetical protein
MFERGKRAFVLWDLGAKSDHQWQSPVYSAGYEICSQA